MISSTILPLLGSALLGVAEANSHRAAFVNAKRGLMTCDETYGPGWIQCGDETSTLCFNPSEGQGCCATDFGYCDAGTFCAPVAGYCCVDGEELSTCAKNAGFSLPGSESASPTLVEPSATYPAEAAGTEGMGSPVPTPTTAPGSTNSTSNTTATGTPIVQVSVAIKEQRTLTLTTLAMAVVGVFMASC